MTDLDTQFSPWYKIRVGNAYSHEWRYIMSQPQMDDPTYKFDPPEGVYVLFDPHTNKRSPFVTTRAHSYRSLVLSITIHSGFRCNFASVPWFLMWLFSPLGLHQRAALFHDYCYAVHPCSRFTADSIFRSILKNDGVSRWRRCLLYYGVRLFGKRAWHKTRGPI